VAGRRVDEISVEDLEQLIAARKAAQARGEPFQSDQTVPRLQALRRWGGRLLTLVEISVVLALVFTVVDWLRTRESSNEAVSARITQVIEVLPTPTTMPAIAVAYLPGGHTPPTSPDGAQPIEASIPEHLRPLVEVATPAPLPTVEVKPEQPIRIVIPSINVDAPVVRGDDWESLQLGVGHHIGSANPGESSNMVLSAHNDIFGEIFRYLSDMELEDEIIVHTATKAYRYRVRAKRIIEPTQVEVMDPTRKATVTLISCYPYLIDTQRIVVIGQLIEEAS
jgi:sortase A